MRSGRIAATAYAFASPGIPLAGVSRIGFELRLAVSTDVAFDSSDSGS